MSPPIAPRQTGESRGVGLVVVGGLLVLVGIGAAVVLSVVPALRGPAATADGLWQGGLIWLCALAVGVGIVLLILGWAKRARRRRSQDRS